MACTENELIFCKKSTVVHCIIWCKYINVIWWSFKCKIRIAV